MVDSIDPERKRASSPRGSIALITTERFRVDHDADLRAFVYGNLYTMSRLFTFCVTGCTYAYLTALLQSRPTQDDLDLIRKDTGLPCDSSDDFERWRDIALSGLLKRGPGIGGMIEVGYSLVEGTLGGIIHLVDWSDMNAKADTAVLWREANVHNIPIALDTYTGQTFVRKWRERFDNH